MVFLLRRASSFRGRNVGKERKREGQEVERERERGGVIRREDKTGLLTIPPKMQQNVIRIHCPPLASHPQILFLSLSLSRAVYLHTQNCVMQTACVDRQPSFHDLGIWVSDEWQRIWSTCRSIVITITIFTGAFSIPCLPLPALLRKNAQQTLRE